VSTPLCFVFNPRSGKNRRDPSLLETLRKLSETSQHRLCVTEAPGHASELAARAIKEGYERIVAVGGDGTMNETAQALLGTQANLGLVPCGSGNGLALHLGIPTQAKEAIRLLIDDCVVPFAIDTGEANGCPFFNVMGLGLDAEISQSFNRLTRRGLGAYIHTSLGAFRRHRSLNLSITSEGADAFQTQALLCSVANSDQYGNRALIAPRAKVNDGKLDLTLLKPMGPLDAMSVTWRLFLGSLDRHPKARTIRASRFIIERDKPGPFHTDGETHEAGTQLEVKVRPASLRILIPVGSKYLAAKR
jgi:diacylglycerol kinase (ATP)